AAQPATATAAGLLTVEPGRPLAASAGAKDDDGGHPRLVVKLRSLATRWQAGPDGEAARLAFPDAAPVGARQREGTLAVLVAAALTATTGSPPPQSPADGFAVPRPAAPGPPAPGPRAGGVPA